MEWLEGVIVNVVVGVVGVCIGKFACRSRCTDARFVDVTAGEDAEEV